jgi:Protein of unknown function (DUF2934)
MKRTEAPSSNHTEAASRKKAAAPKTKSGHSPSTHGAISDSSRTQAISAIAFALYEARGREDGHELDDWLRAEAQVDHALANNSATA